MNISFSTNKGRDSLSAPSLAQVIAAFCGAWLLVMLLPTPFAQAQSGLLLRTFNLKAKKLLLDPGRPRLYATLPEDNGIAVIDTDTNSVVTTIPIGQSPLALAISPDGARLYVANDNTTAQAVTVVDLSTLTVLTNLPAPFTIVAVAAGAGNRLYVLTADGSYDSPCLAQIDATTGQLQTTFGAGVTLGVYGTLPPGVVVDVPGFLRISPDLTTLYCGGKQGNDSTLWKFDVSTATPDAGQAFPDDSTGATAQSLVLSHDGQDLVYANATGNVSSRAYQTLLYSTANFGAYFGSFDIGYSCGPSTFSKDDSVFVEVQAEGGRGYAGIFKLFDRAAFTLRDAFPDPAPQSTEEGFFIDVIDLVLTSPNGYLYYTRTSDASLSSPGYMCMVSTQASPFFDGGAALSGGFYYLKFTDGVPFGYYNFNIRPYLYHLDLGFEYPIDAADGKNGVYLYDFTSKTFWYTNTSLFPYLYDFTLNAWLYYYPDPNNSDRYNTNGVRYFYYFATGQIISK